LEKREREEGCEGEEWKSGSGKRGVGLNIITRSWRRRDE
jgi:hypothetical protein